MNYQFIQVNKHNRFTVLLPEVIFFIQTNLACFFYKFSNQLPTTKSMLSFSEYVRLYSKIGLSFKFFFESPLPGHLAAICNVLEKKIRKKYCWSSLAEQDIKITFISHKKQSLTRIEELIWTGSSQLREALNLRHYIWLLPEPLRPPKKKAQRLVFFLLFLS